MVASPESPLAALGVLSSAGSSGQASGSQYNSRRTSLRAGAQRFQNILSKGTIALRFVIATHSSASLDAERKQYDDIVLLPVNESRFNCALKPLLWFAHCATAFPTALFYAVADDDTYLQLDHFAADLNTLRAAAETQHVLYGLVMWYGTYDNSTMVPHEAWGGWLYNDGGAVNLRRRIERCRDALRNGNISMGRRLGGGGGRRGGRRARRRAARDDPCSSIPNPSRETVARNTLDDFAPFPVLNGPLWAASRSLAAAFVADPYPRQYLQELFRTPRVRAALARPGGPRKSNFGCWPVVDTIWGMWITKVAAARNLSLRLVNTPFMVQHHPWPAAIHGAFSNRSIVLHGLKREKNQVKFRRIAEVRGLGNFVPFDRKCGTCADLGWSSWPGAVHAQWTCCGCDATESRAACDARMGSQSVEQ